MRDETRWAEAREVFLDLAELPETEREQALRSRAGSDADLAAWVRDLLRHDARPSRFEAPQRIGPYELVRPIARGGMGEVFVARRVDGEFEREVAIKRLPKGIASEQLIRRFLRERQTLARLDHEYIARLLDGGTTEDGEPYLVMELVDGVPADEYAARQDLRGRLECFLRIGAAVAHAHERGFVHRDLKPSNILVRADGTPRLLDFGIARSEPEPGAEQADAREPLTRTGHRLFTPEYASPEQVRGDRATPQSDVFALGVLLYEFLTGSRPWDSKHGPHVLERDICETDPTTPARRAKETGGARIPADLDAIVMQCLAKRPSDRYASVDAMCADVRRHLDGLPIQARRTNVLQRIARKAKRRPAHAAVALLLVVAVVLAGVNFASHRAAERRSAELRVAIQSRIETAVLHATNGALDAASTEIDAALSALRELPNDRELEAEALSRKAVFASLRGEWPATQELVDRAFERLKGVVDPRPQLFARLLNSKAYALQSLAPGERSAAAYREARDYTLLHLPVGDVLRVDAITGCALEKLRAGLDHEALVELEQALAEARQDGDPRRQLVARTLNDLAVVHARLGHFLDASKRYREALEILAWNHGEGHPNFARVRFNLATSLFRGGRVEEAREQFARSLEVCRAENIEELVAANLQFLARIHYSRGELREAEAATREALELRERLGAADAIQESSCLLGIVLAALGNVEESRSVLTELFSAEVKVLVELEADARHRLGAFLQDATENEAARVHLERALELKRAWLGPGHAECAEIEERLKRDG